jgi:hypothetical protein
MGPRMPAGRRRVKSARAPVGLGNNDYWPNNRGSAVVTIGT